MMFLQLFGFLILLAIFAVGVYYIGRYLIQRKKENGNG